MEYNSPFDSFELQVSAAARDYLRTAAKWAMFLAIIGFIGIAFMVLVGLFVFAAGSAFSESGAFGASSFMTPAVLGGIYFILALLYFFPVLYLFKFASNTKKALNSNNSDSLTDAFENLKSHYKFLGIVMIIVIASYIIGIIAMAVFFASNVSANM